MNIDQLIQKYADKQYIPYAEYLKTEEWQKRRDEILTKDSFLCTACGKGETMGHYSPKYKKRVYYWFNPDKWLRNEYGIEVPQVDATFSEKSYQLEVHHKFYVVNRYAWEYQDNELTTLCNWCHWEFHKNNNVIVYTEDMLVELEYTPCKRCHGAGWFPQYERIQGGICFRCSGARFEEHLMNRKI